MKAADGIKIATCACAAAACLLFARASAAYSSNSPQGAALAVQLVPFHADYLVRLAAWNPSRGTELLHGAVSLDPYHTQAIIGLGYDAEFRQHDTVGAEKLYLSAAQTNHMFVPKWTLTNFYFRQERPEPFLRWARATLAITPYAAEPVFSEMWMLLPDAHRLASAVPDEPGVLWQYAWFLSGTGRYTAIPAAIQRLVRSTDPSNAELYGKTGIVGPILDKLLQHGFAGEAVASWTALSSAHWLQLPSPSTRAPLTNGDFAVQTWQHGFDWLVMNVSGVSEEQQRDRKRFEIEFSGDQPEQCTLLQQWMPLEAGAYRLRWNAQADKPDTLADVSWHLRGPHGEDFSSHSFAESPAEWVVNAPQPGAYLLSLEYARRPGYTRAEGALLLSHVTAASTRFAHIGAASESDP